MSVIREDEWRAELERLVRESKAQTGEGLTSFEWAHKLGINTRRLHVLLQEAKRRGLLVTGRRVMEGIDGRQNLVPVYALRTQRKRQR